MLDRVDIADSENTGITNVNILEKEKDKLMPTLFHYQTRK
jgi:hypothetical protein